MIFEDIKQNNIKRSSRFVGVASLFLILWLTFSHTEHYQLTNESIDNQQCKLCQHNIDSATKSANVVEFNGSVYIYFLSKYTNPFQLFSPATQALLRAPPQPISSYISIL